MQEADGWSSRQAGRQTDRQTDRQADRQIGRQTDRQIGSQADRWIGRQVKKSGALAKHRIWPIGFAKPVNKPIRLLWLRSGNVSTWIQVVDKIVNIGKSVQSACAVKTRTRSNT